MKYIGVLVWWLMFWGFVTVKMVGHVFAAWSWWWVLLTIVPWLSLLVQKWGL